MRRLIRSLFEAAFALIVIAIVVFVATLLMRGGLALGEIVVVKYLPLMLQKMWADKWYILALVLGALLVWSWPVPDPSWEPSPIRRGRQVTRLPRAAPRTNYTRTSPRPVSVAGRGQSTTSKIRRTT